MTVLDKERLGGIVPPLLTPLLEDESLDEESLVRLVHYHLDSGVHGLFALGSTGEGAIVGRSVWKRATEVVLREAAGRVPVYCGALESGTARTIEAIKELEQMGAQCAVALSPFYHIHFSPDIQSQVYRHFEAVCRHTDVPLLVYSMTFGTHVDIAVDTMERIARLDHVVALKDTRPDWATHLVNLIRLERHGLRIFSGGEDFFAASLLYGSHGNISALTNLFPRLFIDIYEAVRSGDWAKARSEHVRLLDIRAAFHGPAWLAGMKYAAVRRGLFHTDAVCAPSAPLTDEDRRRLDAVLEKHR